MIDSFAIHHETAVDALDTYRKANLMAEATITARNLANVRGTEANPDFCVAAVRKLTAGHSDCTVKVLKGQALLDNHMSLFHAVGRAAQSEPQLCVVHYQGAPESKETIALVGKGVTYDTGGLNIKPTGFMETMYGDKNGASAVLGALSGILQEKPKINVVFAMGFAENSVDSKSYKPGDIIKSRKGLTVEIGNTDAEGRLVLADTLTYVQDHYSPSTVIDLATLTGACKMALGVETAGLFSNDDSLASDLTQSGKDTFERVWRLPICDEHRDDMKSSFADLNNKGKKPYGGASQAASFLERFINPDVKWAHIDIAGPGMAGAQKGPVCADGTGFGTQLLIDYLLKQNN